MRFVLCLACLLAGCAGGLDLSVDLRTDLVVGSEIASTTTELLRPGTSTHAISHTRTSPGSAPATTRCA